MVSLFETRAEALYTTLLFYFDGSGGLVDAIFEQAGRRRGTFGGALDFDLLDDCAAVAVGWQMS